MCLLLPKWPTSVAMTTKYFSMYGVKVFLDTEEAGTFVCA